MTLSTRLEIEVGKRAVDGAEIAFVSAGGEIDLANADELAAALESPTCADADGVVLDLIRVPFIDSTGLRVLLETVRDRAPNFAVVLSPGSPVMRMLDLLGVADQVPTFESEQDAVDAVVTGTTPRV